MTRRLLILIFGAAAFGVLTAIPARHLGGGDLAVVYCGTALLLCLVPGVLTLVWADRITRKAPQEMPLVVLGGAGVRMFGVLIVGFLLLQTVPLYNQQEGFLLWLLASYLFTLTLEMILLLKGRSHPDGSV